LYAARPQVHDRVTQVEGSFLRTLRGIVYLQAHDVPVRAATIAMLQNQDDVEDVKPFLEKLGISCDGFDVVRPSGRGKSEANLPTKPSVLQARTMRQPIFWTNRDTFHWNQAFNPCWAGKINVTASGDVLPCIMAREQIVGNIRQAHLGYIVQGEPLYSWWRLTKDQVEVCRDCEFRYACGDCRVLALGSNGSLYSKYPRCLYNPYTGVWNDTFPKKVSPSRPEDAPEILCVTPQNTGELHSSQSSSSCQPECIPKCLPGCYPNCPPSCPPCFPKCQPRYPMPCVPKCFPGCIPV